MENCGAKSTAVGVQRRRCWKWRNASSMIAKVAVFMAVVIGGHFPQTNRRGPVEAFMLPRRNVLPLRYHLTPWTGHDRQEGRQQQQQQQKKPSKRAPDTINRRSFALSAAYADAELKARLREVQTKVLEKQIRQPPNPKFNPTNFVRAILRALRDTDDPLPDSGCRVLLRSSTNLWGDEIRHSIGAPEYATEDQLASALGAALVRPHNQFGILVGGAEDDTDESRNYLVSFPSETVDYGDGSCWVECHFRRRRDGKLLVATGWELKQRDSDDAWLIDRLDWQDFRDEYRPGIGREEWIRVFG